MKLQDTRVKASRGGLVHLRSKKILIRSFVRVVPRLMRH